MQRKKLLPKVVKALIVGQELLCRSSDQRYYKVSSDQNSDLTQREWRESTIQSLSSACAFHWLKVIRNQGTRYAEVSLLRQDRVKCRQWVWWGRRRLTHLGQVLLLRWMYTGLFHTVVNQYMGMLVQLRSPWSKSKG